MTPGEGDTQVVRRHLLALDSALQNLEKHRGKSVDALRENADERWIVERGLQVCAQNALDISTHLAASGGKDAPDYAAAVDALSALGIIPIEFSQRFRGIAGFRNVLVHGYLEVDLARVHTFLNERLDDFREFARFVELHLTNSK